MRFGNDMITFEEAVAYLKDMPRFTVKKNPADSRDLKWFLKKLGNPEKDLRIIHVAGTNGKGSVCAYMSSILREAGYRTAVFTSPHLVDMRERFAVNGEMISEEAFLQGFLAVWDALQETNSANTGDGQRAPDRHYADQSGSCTVSGRHHSEDRCGKGRDPAPRCSGGVSGRGCGCQCGNLPQSVRTWCDTDTGVEKGLYFPWISEEIH